MSVNYSFYFYPELAIRSVMKLPRFYNKTETSTTHLGLSGSIEVILCLALGHDLTLCVLSAC